jgi:uncharacterized FAD-dependent dehydrogenase
MVVEIQPEDLRSGELRIESGELAAQQNERLLAINPSLNHSQLSTLNSQLLPLHFQEELERQCWLQGGRRQTAPAQRMMDFTRKKLSYDLPESSYSPGIISSPLHQLSKENSPPKGFFDKIVFGLHEFSAWQFLQIKK